jgi:hypothetical protein
MTIIKSVLTGAAFAAAFAAVPAQAEDLVFMLDNKSSTAIHEFYASPVDVKNWEEDILGQDILDAGNFARITIKDGRAVCSYDLRIVFSDGEAMEEPGINLCETGSYTVSDPGE